MSVEPEEDLSAGSRGETRRSRGGEYSGHPGCAWLVGSGVGILFLGKFLQVFK